MVAVSRDHPAADNFDSFLRRIFAYHRSKAQYDSGFAKALPLLMDRLGLTECAHEVTSTIVRGGEPRARLYAEGRRRCARHTSPTELSPTRNTRRLSER
jgi:hypothetical protein